ncbi:hypothetical protein SNEBB_001767 [Seison nebaliae]|nr:hypothetical protein SNEBB_001767 [Seison nebaliae]
MNMDSCNNNILPNLNIYGHELTNFSCNYAIEVGSPSTSLQISSADQSAHNIISSNTDKNFYVNTAAATAIDFFSNHRNPFRQYLPTHMQSTDDHNTESVAANNNVSMRMSEWMVLNNDIYFQAQPDSNIFVTIATYNEYDVRKKVMEKNANFTYFAILLVCLSIIGTIGNFLVIYIYSGVGLKRRKQIEKNVNSISRQIIVNNERYHSRKLNDEEYETKKKKERNYKKESCWIERVLKGTTDRKASLLATKRELNSTYGLFILVLAIADFFVCIVSMPLNIYMEYLSFFTQHDEICKLFQYLSTSNIPISCFLMSAIAFDRFFSVVFPLKTIVNYKRAKKIIIILYLAGLLTGIVPMLAYSTTQEMFELLIQPKRLIRTKSYLKSGVSDLPKADNGLFFPNNDSLKDALTKFNSSNFDLFFSKFPSNNLGNLPNLENISSSSNLPSLSFNSNELFMNENFSMILTPTINNQKPSTMKMDKCINLTDPSNDIFHQPVEMQKAKFIQTKYLMDQLRLKTSSSIPSFPQFFDGLNELNTPVPFSNSILRNGQNTKIEIDSINLHDKETFSKDIPAQHFALDNKYFWSKDSSSNIFQQLNDTSLFQNLFSRTNDFRITNFLQNINETNKSNILKLPWHLQNDLNELIDYIRSRLQIPLTVTDILPYQLYRQILSTLSCNSTLHEPKLLDIYETNYYRIYYFERRRLTGACRASTRFISRYFLAKYQVFYLSVIGFCFCIMVVLYVILYISVQLRMRKKNKLKQKKSKKYSSNHMSNGQSKRNDKQKIRRSFFLQRLASKRIVRDNLKHFRSHSQHSSAMPVVSEKKLTNSVDNVHDFDVKSKIYSNQNNNDNQEMKLPSDKNISFPNAPLPPNLTISSSNSNDQTTNDEKTEKCFEENLTSNYCANNKNSLFSQQKNSVDKKQMITTATNTILTMNNHLGNNRPYRTNCLHFREKHIGYISSHFDYPISRQHCQNPLLLPYATFGQKERLIQLSVKRDVHCEKSNKSDVSSLLISQSVNNLKGDKEKAESFSNQLELNSVRSNSNPISIQEKSNDISVEPVDESVSEKPIEVQKIPIQTFSKNEITSTKLSSTFKVESGESSLPTRKEGSKKNYLKFFRRNRKKRKRTRNANLQAAIVLSIVAFTFFLSYLPVYMIILKMIRYSPILYHVYFINNVANPIIYAFCNKWFYMNLIEIIKIEFYYLRYRLTICCMKMQK